MSDLISRQAVLDYPIRLDHYDEEHGNRHFVLGIESVMEYVESLPSAGQNCILCEYYTEIETDDGIKGKCTRRTGSDLISRQDAIEAVATVTMSIHLSNVLCDKLLALPSADTDRPTRLTNAEWKDFLSESFGISKSSAREMLHGMMSVKREDNFKKRFNQRRGEMREP